jgi:hypothetical protein
MIHVIIGIVLLVLLSFAALAYGLFSGSGYCIVASVGSLIVMSVGNHLVKALIMTTGLMIVQVALVVGLPVTTPDYSLHG